MKALASHSNTNAPSVCAWSIARETGSVPMWLFVVVTMCQIRRTSQSWLFGESLDTKVLNTGHRVVFKNSLCWRKRVKSSVALKWSNDSAYISCRSWILAELFCWIIPYYLKAFNKVLTFTFTQVLMWRIYSLLLLFKIFSCVHCSLFCSVHFFYSLLTWCCMYPLLCECMVEKASLIMYVKLLVWWWRWFFFFLFWVCFFTKILILSKFSEDISAHAQRINISQLQCRNCVGSLFFGCVYLLGGADRNTVTSESILNLLLCHRNKDCIFKLIKSIDLHFKKSCGAQREKAEWPN